MSGPDKRCCGSGVCIINADGECWCGQKWDGTKMSFVPLKTSSESTQTINKSSPCDQSADKNVN